MASGGVAQHGTERRLGEGEHGPAHLSCASSSLVGCADSTRRRRRSIWLVVDSWDTLATMPATCGGAGRLLIHQHAHPSTL